MHSTRSAAWWLLGLMVLSAGCQALDLDFELPGMLNPDNRRRARVTDAIRGEKGHSRLIGDYISIGGDTVRMVQGVGLVIGLDGTGEDPPATNQRKMLLEEMRRRRVDEPETLLRSPNTTMVVVTAYIPPLIRTGDPLDVEIKLPDGSLTKSLKGGYLLPSFLREYAYLPEGGLREGRELGLAGGPILLNGDDANGLLRGVIPGGGQFTGTERNLTIRLREDYRSAKMTVRIADKIGSRFHGYDSHGIKRPLAKPKTDQAIELFVSDQYRDNYPRFLQVIRNIRLTESQVDNQLRLQELQSALMKGDTSEQAALELEAIGTNAIPLLKEGLQAIEQEARFRAAEALAYLDDPSGVEVLKEVVEDEPAFRVFALAALSTLKNGESVLAIRDLMNHSDIEVRYGAFRALSIASPNDPSILTHKFKYGFKMHFVESTASPAVHLTRRRQQEMVLFGADQKLATPIVLRAGKNILVQCPDNSDRVKISLFLPGQANQELVTTTQLSDIVGAAVELGATYPDIYDLLKQAETQRNLSGELAIDRLPRAGRTFDRPDLVEGPSSETVGSPALMPNMFDIDHSGLEVESEMDAGAEAPKSAAEASAQEQMNGVSFEVQ
ncbi:MAG: hypothetical protein DWH91_18430 [Planctomycetota bacterium]|nr:MAG: hypothetical protein DWH91_18430 [Planctomycetota bacterium]